MSEFQPDLLGGKGRPGRRTPKIRRGSRPRIVPAGHADTPGTGPAGETCGSCTYMRDYSYKRTYHKCGARPGDVWKGGRATDVRPLDAACSKWAATIARINAPPEPPRITAAMQEAIADSARDIADFGMSMVQINHELSTYGGMAIRKVDQIETDGPRITVVTPARKRRIQRTPDKSRMPVYHDIVAALRAAPEGLTVDQVAEAIKADPHAVRPRISELAAVKAIEKTDERRPGSAGRSLAVWILRKAP